MRTSRKLLILFSIALLSGCEPSSKPETQEPMTPPLAKKIAKNISLHGKDWTDNYFWLNNKKDSAVIKHLEAENAYTDATLKHTEDFQKKLYEEMKGRIKEEDISVATKEHGYYYYSRTEKDKQYRVHCRRKGSMEAPEEIILDENKLAEGKKYFRLGNFETSPNQQLLAYSTDSEGDETYTLYVKDLSTGKLLADEVPNTYYSLAWANDNQTFFYTQLDHAYRPYRLLRHVIGQAIKADALVYEEKDEMYTLQVGKSKTEDFIFLNLGSSITSEVRVLKADQPDGIFAIFQPRQKGIEYSIEHHKNRFYIRTNENAKNFKLMETPVAGWGKEHWKEVIAHNPDIKLEDVDVYDQFLAVYERSNGLIKIRINNLANKQSNYVAFPEAAYMIYAGYNPDYYSSVLRYSYTSLVRPTTTYDYDTHTDKSVIVKENEVMGGYNASLYQTERIFAKANDGTMIPISLVFRKGLKKDGENPCYLYGYGSYGVTIDATFSSNRISLLDRGFVFAIAHIRGGGDLGEEWRDNGKLLKKKNTFTDFINSAEYLIAEKYTNKEKLAISGGSAGGLLMGAVTNMRPDLFKAVIAKVPFVDVVNTMMDASLPLTIGEYDEWGNPNEKEYFDYISTYSPYDNVEKKAYPHILATAGLNDPRVSYWEPAKWVAKLRELKTDSHKTLLHTNMGAGHGGASGRFDYLKDIALEYAFAMDALGMGQEFKRTKL
jgi:oligopeptidase B